jgi:hypothetical protein
VEFRLRNERFNRENEQIPRGIVPRGIHGGASCDASEDDHYLSETFRRLSHLAKRLTEPDTKRDDSYLRILIFGFLCDDPLLTEPDPLLEDPEPLFTEPVPLLPDPLINESATPVVPAGGVSAVTTEA